MEILVAYDINTQTKVGERRLRRVAKVCEGFGHRVQKSVFECIVDQAQFHRLVASLARSIDPREDSVLLYRLREPFGVYVKRLGLDYSLNPREPFVL